MADSFNKLHPGLFKWLTRQDRSLWLADDLLTEHQSVMGTVEAQAVESGR
jgi:hypothetical protein